MSPEEIYAAFRRPIDAFPEAAFQEALKRSDEMRPLLLEALKKDWANSGSKSDGEGYGSFYALLLLAKWRSQELHHCLLEFLSGSEEQLDDVFADTWTEYFALYLRETFDGDHEGLFAVLRNHSCGEHSRHVVNKALFELCVLGQLDRELFVKLLTEQLNDERNSEYLCETWAYKLFYLCPLESEDLMRESGLFTKEEFLAQVALGVEGCLADYRQNYRIQDLTTCVTPFSLPRLTV